MWIPRLLESRLRKQAATRPLVMLTGSEPFVLMQAVAESLAGRAAAW